MLTHADGRRILVNPDAIETVEQMPRTTVKFVNGRNMPVTEEADEVARRFMAYKRAIHADDRALLTLRPSLDPPDDLPATPADDVSATPKEG